MPATKMATPSDIAEAYMLKYSAAEPPLPPPQMVCLEEALARGESDRRPKDENRENYSLCPREDNMKSEAQNGEHKHLSEKRKELATCGPGELQRVECEVCKVWTCGPIPMAEHKQGSRHRNEVLRNRNMRSESQEGEHGHARENTTKSSKSVQGELQRLECEVCNVWMCGPIPMAEHMKGQRHRKAVRQKEEGLYFGELAELEALLK